MFRDTMETIYPLGDSDVPSVRQGDTVAAGDVIAHGPEPAAIAAYAATLRLSVDEAADDLARHHGREIKAGNSLGMRRVGLVTRTISAPATGTMHTLPRSGALVIRSDRADCERHARYAGIVRDVREEAIAVTSAVARCVYAFTGGDTRHVGQIHIDPALLKVPLTTKTMPRSVPSASSLILAHIADLATLHALTRSARGTFFIGSVTEPVAWSLLSRSESREGRRAHMPGIIVLSGVGDLAHGVHAVASFRDYHGAHAILDRLAHAVTLMPPAGTFPEADTGPEDADQQSAIRRDPANYDIPCEIHGAPVVALLHTGARVLCARTSGSPGERFAPSQNVRRD